MKKVDKGNGEGWEIMPARLVASGCLGLEKVLIRWERTPGIAILPLNLRLAYQDANS
jgi:hypothetical protein